ncbi:MAG: class I SAM-dependent methyltransferase [Acidobacteriia bacterium]|nr:class I SAM-dependent methyltransferase [Terriglobia bacterium]
MTRNLARGAFLKNMAGMRHGSLRWTDGSDSQVFGDAASDLQAEITVVDQSFYWKLISGGEDGAGDAWVDGLWTSPDPVAVVRFAIRNLDSLEQGNRLSSFISRMLNRLAHLRRDNTVEGSRRNIHEHYDLSNDFFRLFLDKKMVYSSAIYEREETTLEDAQIEKIDRLCRKLGLQPGDHVLEIGTGWGAMALHAAEVYGCRVTTTTISQQQFDGAKAAFARSGARDRIELLFEDYRKLQGQYDHIVSVEMFEAVGLDHYDEFFGACDRLLKPGGAMAMQAITMNEQKFPAYQKGSDWIQKRIFPGAELASVKEVLASLQRATKMSLLHLEDIGIHYALTLAEWRRRFHARASEVRALGFDDRFMRTWDYYLAYCEAAFRERHIGDVQVVMTKNNNVRWMPGDPGVGTPQMFAQEMVGRR